MGHSNLGKHRIKSILLWKGDYLPMDNSILEDSGRQHHSFYRPLELCGVLHYVGGRSYKIMRNRAVEILNNSRDKCLSLKDLMDDYSVPLSCNRSKINQ